MWDIMLKIVLSLLIIMGLTDVFRALSAWLLNIKVKGTILYILPVQDTVGETEIALRSVIHRLRTFSGKEEKRILCVDCGADEESAEICRKLMENWNEAVFCTREEAVKKIEGMFAKQ